MEPESQPQPPLKPQQQLITTITPKQILSIGIPVLVIYCLIGMPAVGNFVLGKMGLVGAELDIGQIYYHFLMAIFWLCIVPLLALKKYYPQVPLSYFGNQIGDRKFGLILVAIAIVIVPPLLYVGTSDPGLQAIYPLSKLIIQPWAMFVLYEMLYVLLYYTAYEFFFRGIMQLGLSKTWGRWQAIVFATVITTFIHWWPMAKPLSEILGALFAGFLFGYIAEKTNSWYYVFIIHITVGICTDTFCSLRFLGVI